MKCMHELTRPAGRVCRNGSPALKCRYALVLLVTYKTLHRAKNPELGDWYMVYVSLHLLRDREAQTKIDIEARRMLAPIGIRCFLSIKIV